MTIEHLSIINAIDARSSRPPKELYILNRSECHYCIVFMEGNLSVEGRAQFNCSRLEDIWWANARCSVQTVLDESDGVWHKYYLGVVI